MERENKQSHATVPLRQAQVFFSFDLQFRNIDLGYKFTTGAVDTGDELMIVYDVINLRPVMPTLAIHIRSGSFWTPALSLGH